MKDDHFVFKADGIYQQTDGATKCSPNDPFVLYTTSWVFGQNETMLTIGIGGTPQTIDVLDETTLGLTITSGTTIRKDVYGH